jgi:hypothetical protein
MVSNKDIVAGVITGYTFDAVQYWVNSLDRSTFSGLKVVLCANVEAACIRELERRNYTIVKFDQRESRTQAGLISQERFYHIWQFLTRAEVIDNYRFVTFLDVRDVIVQYNPSVWLEQNLGEYDINVGAESIRHLDEKWAKEMMIKDFGNAVYETLKDQIIYNAGTMAGKIRPFAEFCLNIYLTSRHCSPYSDQAAANILISLQNYKERVKLSPAESGWACQAGISADPTATDHYRTVLTEPEPVFNGEFVQTSSGRTFCLVHQYDRVPEWAQKLQKIYGSKATTVDSEELSAHETVTSEAAGSVTRAPAERGVIRRALRIARSLRGENRL